MSASIAKYKLRNGQERSVLILEGDSSHSKIRFGIAKARVILEHWQEIEKFAASKGEKCE